MGTPERAHRGGIGGLAGILKDHGKAIEFELIRLGLRLAWLGTPALSWRDLLVIVEQLPPGSALHRSMDPEGSLWTVETHLLAGIFDVLAIANWQRAGGAERDRPTPLPRPGLPEDPGTETWTGKPVSIEEMNEKLGWKGL